ncbi:alcohol dehydrogenase-like regulatory protein ErcA [Oleidesulfovibrio sp.]|uniref:alcohol dehydrogenase-like regulatory protein ErcA n=1 Tax=Oleidesulfovibrio sp. TaxID=2909707 RepID=UPI003A84F438
MSEKSLYDLRKLIVPEVVFGVGALRLVGQYAENFNLTHCLVVTDAGVVASGWADSVLDALGGHGIKTTVFDAVSPNPRDYEVRNGVNIYLKAACDGIVAVGGGSPMDCAKGIGLMAAGGKDILEFEGVDKVDVPAPPLICIPTTAGTSADVSQFAIINDVQRKVKISIVSKSTIPDLALIDPATTHSMPQRLTASTGLDALCHAVEAYSSTVSSPMTDLFALRAIRLISENLLDVIDDGENAHGRENMMLASMYAGFAFSNAILGAVHAMAHGLGGLLNLPHGECNAILMPPVVRANCQAVPQRCADIARELGVSVKATSSDYLGDALYDHLMELRHKAGITGMLSELGGTRDAIPSLAYNAMRDACMLTNPRRYTQAEVELLYEEAF